MEYKLIGNTGIMVSSLCFGTMSFGGDADEVTSAAMFHRCREVGINFFDCADVYNNGMSEEILGQFISDCREEVIITSKVYAPTGDDVNARGANRKHIMFGIEKSLTRLKTDYLDFYFIHRFDDNTPIAETVRALDDLVKQGKILYPAASNFAAWQIAKALGIAEKESLSRFECIQPMYSLVKRQAEVEILPLAEAENLGVIPYSPLGAGMLTGKYGPTHKPESGRLIDNQIYKIRYSAEWMYDTADDFTNFAHQHGFDPIGLAVAWVASHPAVTAPIIGARNLDQLEGSLKSLQIKISPDLRDEISGLSPEPPPATDRNDERAK